MNYFKDFRMKLWRVGLLKIAVASVSIIIGVYFTHTFRGLIPILWILYLVPGAYLGYV